MAPVASSESTVRREITPDVWRRYPELHARFEFVKTLGDGAAATVLAVRDLASQDKEVVALKILTTQDAFDEQTVIRFEDEITIGKRLSHPSITRIDECFRLSDTLAFTMELVEGADLGAIFQERSLEFSEIDKIFPQVLGALREMHRHGVLHRDVKMENVLVRADGVTKLSDLGLSKQSERNITRTGVLLGTAQYLPPEYIRKGRYDQRGDIYALGVMLFELFSGERWLYNHTGAAAIEELLRIDFKLPLDRIKDIPAKYRYIISRATSPDPALRFESAGSMLEAFSLPLDYKFSTDETQYQDEQLVGAQEATRFRSPRVVSRKSAQASFSLEPISPTSIALAIMSIFCVTVIAGIALLVVPDVRQSIGNYGILHRPSLPASIYNLTQQIGRW